MGRSNPGAPPCLPRAEGAAAARSRRAGGTAFVLSGAVILLAFVALGLPAIVTHTPTVDEFSDLPMGLHLLTTGRFDMDRRNPPLMKMAAALPAYVAGAVSEDSPEWIGSGEGWWPWIYGTRFMRQNEKQYLSHFRRGRCVVLAVAVVGGLVLLWWARRLYGAGIALAALFLYCTDPTILGHATLATLDVGAMCFLLGSLAAWHRWCEGPALRFALAGGALFGLATASKFSSLFAAPVIALLLAWRILKGGEGAWWPRAAHVLAAALVALAAVNAVYLFKDPPLPADMLSGISLKAGDAASGEFPGYLMGQWRLEGWWYYYPVAAAVKFPLPLIVLVILGSLSMVRRRWRPVGFLWIVLPAAAFVWVLSFHYRIDYGVRYLLPVLPSLLLLAGNGVRVLWRGRRGRWAVALLLGWQAVAAVRSTPHHLAYFNELAAGHERQLLLDSNLDWGQDLGRLASHLRRVGAQEPYLAYFGHVDPALYGIRYRLAPSAPAPGVWAVSANFLGGYPYGITYREGGGPSLPLGVPAGTWSWLDRFRPVARVGRSIYLFSITGDDPP